MPSINFGDANTSALAEYFIRKYNLVGRDAEYTKNRVTLRMVPRDTERLKGGDLFYETLRIADGFSDSPDWVNGNKYFNVSSKVRWQVGDPYPQYSRLTFDNLALARNNTGTLIDLKASEADGVANGMLDTLEFQLWNDGKGSRCKIGTLGGSAATRVITCATVSDVYNVPYGAVLEANTANDGSGTVRADLYKVTDLNPVAGQFTMTRISGAGGDVAANDFLFVKGSANAYMPGIPSFIPSSDPADTLFGVTRTGNPALSGWRFTYKGSISETIQRAFATMGRWVNRAAGKFVVCLSTTDWLLLSLEREGRVFEDPSAMQKWGVDGLTVRTPFGPITCVAIPQMSDGRGYIIDWTSWKLFTLKNLPHVVDEDGMTFVRLGISDPILGNLTAPGLTNGDGLAMQMRIWKVLLCMQPMSNATFPTV
jgi:hypothetical protein